MTHLIRRPQVIEGFGISKTTLFTRIQEGLIPPPISLGGRAVAWPSDEIEQVISFFILEKPISEIKILVSQLVATRQERYSNLGKK